jgi:hypothetical protein
MTCWASIIGYSVFGFQVDRSPLAFAQENAIRGDLEKTTVSPKTPQKPSNLKLPSAWFLLFRNSIWVLA